ncbi:MAG: Fic family protein [Oscillospiraceae bacterium]|jgi:Fic family protein|nr:Fic family protein [Oscillospiraceae bacterium]
MLYDEIIASWHEKKIRTAADIALEMNGNGASFIYHSAKIENDSITYHDTREIFDHGGVTSYTGDVRSLFEIQNSVAAYYRMLDAFEKREPMSEALICEFQGLLTQGTYDPLRYQKGERPGTYKQHDYVTGAKEVGALPEDVPEELAELIAELNDVEPRQALTAAAYFHAKFENIHPFADGNGRTGRLLMNYLLLLWDHPPIIIHEEDRRAYYDALEKFDEDQELAPLTAFLGEQTVKTWRTRFEREQARQHK